MKKYLFNIIPITSRQFIVLLALPVLIGLQSCEDFFLSEVTNLNVPGSRPQLVVFSFISPTDSVIKVYVDRSVPYLSSGKAYEPVYDNASVTIARQGGEPVSLVYVPDKYRFEISASLFPIEAGVYYVLEVVTTKGEKATARCYVPEFELQRIELDPPVQSVDSWGSTVSRFNWRVTTPSNNQPNHYRTGAFMRTWEISYGWNQTDTFYVGSSPIWLDSGQPFFQHEGSKLFGFRAKNYDRYTYPYDRKAQVEPMEKQQTWIDSFYVYVIHSDVHYFNYHQSLENYFLWDDDFPLAESVHIYSNINGGLGAFGGYNKRVYPVPAQ